MTALCVFTLEDWLIKRLCANFRHSVCNRARRGIGNDLIGQNAVLAGHARTIAGGDVASRRFGPGRRVEINQLIALQKERLEPHESSGDGPHLRKKHLPLMPSG